MTPQEKQQLEEFLVQLTHVGYVDKDPQAAEAIAAAFSQQPDAPYLTVQRCLLLNEALIEAHTRIAELEAREASANTPRAAASFNAPTNGWLASAALHAKMWQGLARSFARAN
jgi:hypothetical protein